MMIIINIKPDVLRNFQCAVYTDSNRMWLICIVQVPYRQRSAGNANSSDIF